MDVLLIGSTGSLMRRMVEKLHKEGHRIFVLTEEGKDTLSYRRVFETYRFSYDNACIREVFVSVKPAVTLFFGAYDKNFSWSASMNASVAYSSGLLNILMSFSALRQGRFIYLSSQEVYEDLELLDNNELKHSGVSSEKAQAVAMGEKMCLDYGRMTRGDVVVLRMGDLYGIPEDTTELDNICAKMCIDALDLGEMKLTPGRSALVVQPHLTAELQREDVEPVEGERQYAPLHLMDAVAFIYKLMIAEGHKKNIYQISGKDPISQRRMAELIVAGMKTGQKDEVLPTIVESIEKSETNVLLDYEDADMEFGLYEMNPPQKAIPALASYIKKHAGKFSRRTDRQESMWDLFVRKAKEVAWAAVPFLENVVCFIPFFMLNNRATDNIYFRHLDFYLLYVLLFAIVHGQQQAIFSSLLAIAGYCFRQMYERSGFEVMLDYSTYVWMAQLLILGLVVGYMKDKLRSIKEENANEVAFLNRQLADMSDINGSNVRVKDVLSDQLVNQNDSIGKIYEITSRLEQYAPEEVIFYAADVVAQVMHSSDVAIYTVANATYARLSAATSEKAKGLGNSVHYAKMEQMYRVLCEKKVFINKNMTEEYPLMANAIYSGDKIQIIVMVWGISWERMTLGQANTLAVTSSLIQNAVLRANRYMDVLRSQRYISKHIMEKEAFEQLVAAFLRARERKLTQCALLEISTGGLSLEMLDDKLDHLVRETDYIGRMDAGRLEILLANSGTADAGFVLKRLEDAGMAARIMEEEAKE
ncbi:MAG: NAD-dependent epimerase/dehydratase family protein [Lachnospiraceae bacterium]|nr:NAD-dependent epimerase/dehydratase family protein [Lachnospiraceae bacterium]